MAKRSIIQKVTDAVDHMVHPDKAIQSEKPVKNKIRKVEKSSDQKNDYADHPKFAKFKSIQGAD